jgi:hypothetical protein
MFTAIILAQIVLGPCSGIQSRMVSSVPCLDDGGQPTTILQYDVDRYAAMKTKPKANLRPDIWEGQLPAPDEEMPGMKLEREQNQRK